MMRCSTGRRRTTETGEAVKNMEIRKEKYLGLLTWLIKPARLQSGKSQECFRIPNASSPALRLGRSSLGDILRSDLI